MTFISFVLRFLLHVLQVHFSKGFIELEAASVLMLIFFPFSLSTTISFPFFSSLGWCFSNKAFILFFFFTQYSFHLVISTVWRFHNFVVKYQYTCASTESLHKWWQLETWFVYLYTLEWSDGQLTSCPLTIGCFPCQSSFAYWRNQVRAVCHQFSHVSRCAPLYSVSCLQSNFLTQRGMNQNMNHGFILQPEVWIGA